MEVHEDEVKGLLDAILGSTRAFQAVGETKEQARQRCAGFFARVVSGEATPKRIIDFAYADKKGLGLTGEAMLLERCYCFEDTVPAVAGAKRGGDKQAAADDDGFTTVVKSSPKKPATKNALPKQERVILHVHTLVEWGNRNAQDTRKNRALVQLTSVNLRHATKVSYASGWKEEHLGFTMVPVREPAGGWQKYYPDRRSEIEWTLQDPNSVPVLDKDYANKYKDVRDAILKAEEVLSAHADRVTTKSISQTLKSYRSADRDIEFEVMYEEEEEASSVGIEFLAIGNDAYTVAGMPNNGRLRNCVSDATKVMVVFDALGARCRLLPDKSRRRLKKEVNQWAEERLQGQVRVAFILWAGHAFTVKGETHLLPTSAGEEIPLNDLDFEDTVPLRDLLAVVRKFNEECHIVMCLDSCRVEVQFIEGASFGFESPEKGKDAGSKARRTDIVYSTAYGETADDESPFVKSLLECLGDDSLVHGTLYNFWGQVRHRAQRHCAEQQPRIDPGSDPEFTLLPRKSTSPAAELVTQSPPICTAKFYSYIVMQPGNCLTWHIQPLKRHALMVRQTEQGLRAKDGGGWLAMHRPICLVDENDMAAPIRHLREGGTHSLVLSALGRGWVPWVPKYTGPTGELEPLIKVFKQSGWPCIIVVCQLYGSRTTAERLFEESQTKATVVWFKQEVSRGDVFSSMLPDVLSCASSPDADTGSTLAGFLSVQNFLCCGPQGAMERLGVCKGISSGDPGWTLSDSREREHLEKVKPLELQNRHLDVRLSEKFHTNPCDIRLFGKLIQRVEQNANRGLRIHLQGVSSQTRLLAYQVCKYFEYRPKFDSVTRLRNQSDFDRLRTFGDGLALMWIDLCATTAECEEALEEVIGREENVVLLLTHNGNAETEELRESLVAVGDWDVVEVSNNGEASQIPADAKSLHEEIRLTRETKTRLDLWDLSTVIQQVLPDPSLGKEGLGHGDTLYWVPIAGIFEDDDNSLLVRLCISDVEYLHRLRDLVFTEKLIDNIKERFKVVKRSASQADAESEINIRIDMKHFAERFEKLMCEFEEPTEHQKVKLAEYEAEGGSLHITAPAGAGKTFVGVRLMLEVLELSSDGEVPIRVLFVASNEAMAIFVANWICKRLVKDAMAHRDAVLQRLHLLFPSSDSKCVYSVSLNDSDWMLVTAPTEEAAVYAMIVVDEAHHVYRPDAKAHVKVLRERVKQRAARSPRCRLVLLSDVSQSEGQEPEYPNGLYVMNLHEVVRSTQRIVAGASAFQLVRTSDATRCNGPPGDALHTFIFPKGKLYADQIAQAIQERVVVQFPGLCLHNRLAIVVPDAEFREKERKSLERALQTSKVLTGRQLRLVTAREASACVVWESLGDKVEWIVYDTVDAMDGLERLIVMVVGLDEEGSAREGNGKRGREVRSRIYRAMTRAHMMVCIVNEALQGGWLEFLLTVKFDKDRKYDHEEAVRMGGSANQIDKRAREQDHTDLQDVTVVPRAESPQMKYQEVKMANAQGMHSQQQHDEDLKEQNEYQATEEQGEDSTKYLDKQRVSLVFDTDGNSEAYRNTPGQLAFDPLETSSSSWSHGPDEINVFLNENDVERWLLEDGGQLRVAREALNFGLRAADEAEGDRKFNAGDFMRFWDDAHGGRVKVIGRKEFPYSKGGTLQGDDRLVDCEYWLRVPGSKEYVVLHVRFEGRWNAKYWLRPKDVVLQANVRHSVTAAKPQVPVYYDKCKDLDTWREKKGTPVQGLPDRWRWRRDAKAHEALAALLSKGEQCTTFVRSLAAAEATKSRHALIIAVGKYRSESISDLPNAVNDGMLLKETLEALGWDVEILVNPTREEAWEKLMDFILMSKQWKDAVLFAFFGYGIEPYGTQQNLLVMNDTEIPEEANNASEFERMLGDRCVNLFKFMPILNTFREEAGYPPTISILDCCRDQLEPRVRSLFPSRAAATHADVPIYRGGGWGPEFKNLVTIYSTTSGNTAGDGVPGVNGPFMASFHVKMLQPGLELTDALREVHRELGDQAPVPKGMLLTKFYFAGEIEKVVVEAQVGGDAVAGSPVAAGGATQFSGDADSDDDAAEIQEWIHSIKGITKQGREAVWKMLEDEEFCTMEAVLENVEDIKRSDGFANLRIATRSGLEKALERLQLSDAGAPSPAGTVE